LQVSSISILLGILVGGQLLGVLGTLLALPITAAIPVLERVWNEDVPEELGEDAETASAPTSQS
jgi:predicted PurR-regulated permease PerM